MSVWISSMKRIAFSSFAEPIEHLLDALLEVAAVAGAGDERRRGRARTRASRAAAPARRPVEMRSASPSASAVLPTPGSPTSSGLFLRRRHSTWTMRSISASRPISGSISPLRGARDQIGGKRLERIARAPAPRPAPPRRGARGSVCAAVRDHAQQRQAIDALLAQEVRRVAVVFLQQEHEQRAAVDLLRARRGGVHDGALDDAVEADRRFGLHGLLAGHRRKRLAQHLVEIAPELRQIDAAGRRADCRACGSSISA